MSDLQVSVVLHGYDNEAFSDTLNSVLKQKNNEFEIVIIAEDEPQRIRQRIDSLNSRQPLQVIITEKEQTLGAKINQALQSAQAPFVLYLNNTPVSIQLKQSALDLYLMAAGHHAQAGMIYTDYELEEDGDVREVRLLKHHIGRVRDNQDYGRVFFMRRSALEAVHFCDDLLKFNTLYDLRLKLSEQFELLHIANRYAGSLYRLVAEAKSHNVFDYLLASKESQLEAERVVSEHLKRIKAYLAPGTFYADRPPATDDASLKASVIIPVNNRPQFIGPAIESVQNQTIAEVEAVVVVNGGDTDPTIGEVKRYLPGGDKYDAQKPAVQLVVVDINNIGLCLNVGAQTARGAYYVQLDSDDRLKPEAVEKILAVYDSDPRIGMVIGSYEVWQLDDAGNYTRMEDLPVVTHDEWTEENGRNNLLRINGAGAPRSIPIQLIRDIGFSMNEEPFARNYGEDYHMVLQISEKHRIGRVWDAIYEVVRHSGGTDHSIDQATIDRNDEAKDYMRAEAIRRRIRMNKMGNK